MSNHRHSRGAYGQLLLRYLRPQGRTVALLAILLLLSIGLQLANPQLVRAFIDAVEQDRPVDFLLRVAALFVTLALIRQTAALAATYVGETVAWRATNDLRADLADHCLRLDMTFHKQHKPGELIERVDGDVNELANFFSRLVIQLAANLLLFLGAILLLALIDWRLGLSVLGIAVAGALFWRALHQRVVPLWQRLRAANADLFGYTEEWLNGTEDIQSSGAAPFVMRRLYQLLGTRIRRVLTLWRINLFITISPVFVFALAYIAAHIWGAVGFRAGALSLGAVYLSFYYIDVVRSPLFELLWQLQDLQRALASLNRIDDLLAEQPQLEDGSGAPLPHGPLAVTFDRVHFHYADEPDRPVLADVNIHLPPGAVLGLVGRTGSGKTTLTRLLLRFYDPTAGAIYLEAAEEPAESKIPSPHLGKRARERGSFGEREKSGQTESEIDLRHTTRADLRARLGMVTQDVELFNATVRDNLTLFDPTMDDARLLTVVEELGLGPWLATQPAGLDTLLEGSGGLSAGQAQLLAFARVFLRDPGLVILDEASSRLDPATEHLIEQAVDRLLENRTAIIIAHRLHTVQRADQILILEQGRVAEYGARVDLAADPDSRFAALLRTGRAEELA